MSTVADLPERIVASWCPFMTTAFPRVSTWSGAIKFRKRVTLVAGRCRLAMWPVPPSAGPCKMHYRRRLSLETIQLEKLNLVRESNSLGSGAAFSRSFRPGELSHRHPTHPTNRLHSLDVSLR